ncbi:hypothetical protein W02_35500 [Nitrospira sp. KM1]|nr:hypothetical protein W02_35500 [Nitrospira sp. KM1]
MLIRASLDEVGCGEEAYSLFRKEETSGVALVCMESSFVSGNQVLFDEVTRRRTISEFLTRVLSGRLILLPKGGQS